MPKEHKVKLKVYNHTAMPLRYNNQEHFYSGRRGDGERFEDIAPDNHNSFLMYEKDNTLEGCSGYVVFQHEGMRRITIAFSNPAVGKNKINVGLGDANSEEVWNNMTDHYADNGRVLLGDFSASFTNTGGSVSQAEVHFYDYPLN